MWRSAPIPWRNPVGLALLGLGAAAAALTAVLPPLEPWSGRAGGVALLALLAYGGTVAVHGWPRREAPEVREIRRLRDAMAEQLAVRRGEASPLADLLAEALARLDHELLPGIALLVDRHAALRADLARFERGELAAPGPEALGGLRSIERRQREAIADARQQVADAYAATLALGQQSADEARVVAEARRWSEHLGDVQNTLAELIDESADWDRRLAESPDR
jgi:hypothetical protein